MDIRVLGPVEVHNGHKLAIGGPRQRRILAALALHAPEVVSLDRLVDITWSGEGLPDQPETNMRTYVYRLRSGLGGELGDRVETAPHGYVLRAGSDDLDYRRFEHLVRQADRVAVQGDATSALAYVDEALTLWRGRPYQEFEGEPWVEAECSRLMELRALALERRGDALIQLGRPEEATVAIETLIAEYPYRERPRRLLMLALYNSGRHPEAVRAFQEFRAMLVDEAGIDPSTELSDLERRMLERDPELRVEAERPRSLRSYELEDVIGEGAFAMVWRGTQPILGREVAVKQVRSRLANDPDFIRRFEVEAQLVASLEHPFIVPLYDYWREPDAAFLVMRLLRGGTLENRIAAGPLADRELRRLVEQVGSALAAAHRNGVIHRDVKPGNILLDEDGSFYLTDFGIAFGAGNEADDNAAAALSTGSPAYASPEQLRRERLDLRTDIYAFGTTLFEAATGHPPFRDETTRAGLVQRQLEEPLPSPSTLEPAVPRWVDTVVATATAKRPEDRYADIQELVLTVDAAAPSPVRASVSSGTLVGGELRNPFKGLRAFTEADANDFRGRQRLVTRLIAALERPGSEGRLVAVVGPSGSGKSSVVRAGLVPALHGGAIAGSDQWFVTTMMPGSNPFDELESALARVAVAPPGPLAQLMASDERGIARVMEQILPNDNSELVLVVDQFEELFTMAAEEAVTRRFLDGLLAAVRGSGSRLRVVVTIRADFWDRPLKHPGLAPLLETAAVTVSPLSADELEQVIVSPVAAQGVEYEPGLVARISADVLDQAGALPLLQYTLTDLFDRNVAGVILASSYDELGGIGGALSARAEELYQGLDEPERVSLRRTFGRLVSLGEGTGDTRRRVMMTEVGDDAVADRVVAKLDDARLVTFDRDNASREPTVEIAHEALLQAWPRLRDWIDEDRDSLRVHRRLTTAAADWDRSGRDDDELYRGARLDGVTMLREQDPDALNKEESAFVAASVARDVKETRRRRRTNRILQGALAATAVLAVVAVAASLLAFERARDAEQARDEAERTSDELVAEVLVSSIADTAATDPVLGALLAAELYDLDPSARSLDAVARALLALPDWMGAFPGEWIGYSEAGPWLVVTEHQQIVLRDPEDLSITRTIPTQIVDRQFAPVLSPDGRALVLDQPSGLVIVDLETGGVGSPVEVEIAEGGGQGVAWTNDGQFLLAVGPGGTVAVLGVQGTTAVETFRTDLDIQPFGPWLEAHPTEPLVALAALGVVVTVDTSAIADGRLVERERFDLAEGNEGGFSSAHWGDDGLYIGAVDTTGFRIRDGVAEPLEFASDRIRWAEPLSDGSVFLSEFGGLGGQATIIDADSGAVLNGPWSLGNAGDFEHPVELDGGDVIAVVGFGMVHMFSRAGGNPLSETLPPMPIEAGAVYLPDGSVVQSDRGPHVWTVESGRAEEIDPGIDGVSVFTINPTTDGSRGAVMDTAGNVTIHELPSGALVAGPFDVGGAGFFPHVSPDGERLLLSTPTGLSILDATTGQELASFEHGDVVSSWIRVRGDLVTVQGGFDNPNLLIVNHETLEEVHRGGFNASNFTLDGSGFFTPTDFGVVSIVEMGTGEIQWSAAGLFAGFEPTGEFVATEFDGVQFYEYSSADPVGPRVEGLAWMHTEIGVLTQTREGRVHIWNIDPRSWPEVACAAAGRNLTRVEWETHIPGDRPYAPTCDQWPTEP